MAVIAALATALVVGAGAARADRWSLHGTGVASAGWTDNVQNQSDGESDFFYEAAPGLLFTFESPNSIQELIYEFRYVGYVDNSDANSFGHRVGWQGFFLLSRRAELTLGAGVTSGETNTFRAPDGAVTSDFMPTGTEYVGANATELIHYIINRTLRATQTLSIQRLDSHAGDIETDGTTIGASFGLDRSWKRDGLGVTGGLNYVTFTQADESHDQISTMIEAQWRRDLSLRWSTLVNAGLSTIIPILDQPEDDPREVVHSPTAGASLAYFPRWGSLRLGVRRAMTASLFLAQNTVTDSATLNAWLPIPWFVEDPLAPILTASGGLSVQRSQLVNLEVAGGEVANAYGASAALHYSPFGSEVGVSLRYSLFHQSDDPNAIAPRFEQFTRNTIMLEVHGRWPEERAAVMPQRDALRVDGTDMTPVGEEEGAE